MRRLKAGCEERQRRPGRSSQGFRFHGPGVLCKAILILAAGAFKRLGLAEACFKMNPSVPDIPSHVRSLCQIRRCCKCADPHLKTLLR